MKIEKRQLTMCIISTLISMSVLMMFTYVHASVVNSNPTPFYMTSKHIVMKSESLQHITFDDIIDVDKDKSIIVISRDSDSEVVGIYDPNMIFAFENTFVSAGLTRYFSYDDYINKTKAGVLVLGNQPNDLLNYKSLTNERIQDVIYSVDSQSRFNYDGKIKEVINLASFQALGDTIYIDYGDKEIANKLVTKLTNFGYRKYPQEPIGLLKALMGSDKNIIEVIMSGGVLIYIAFAVIAFWSFYNIRKEVSIHFLHGGTIKTVSKNLVSGFAIWNLFGMVPVLFLAHVLRNEGYLLISKTSLWSFIMFHVLLTLLLYILAFCLMFRIIRNSKRGGNYVR